MSLYVILLAQPARQLTPRFNAPRSLSWAVLKRVEGAVPDMPLIVRKAGFAVPAWSIRCRRKLRSKNADSISLQPHDDVQDAVGPMTATASGLPLRKTSYVPVKLAPRAGNVAPVPKRPLLG